MISKSPPEEGADGTGLGRTKLEPRLEDADDRFIAGRVAAGEKELFRYLVARHQRGVYNMGRGFFHNREDASDFVQEVFLKVYRSLTSFEGRSRFSTWLYTIAYNTAVNGITRRREYQSLAESDEVVDGDTPERSLVRGAARSAVLTAVGELPERYRICVDMYFFYDRSYQEIGAITGFPVNTIKSHVFRAKKLLKERLKGIAEGGFE
ncbi:MAG: sigma-70 family RNA polymerase sigma factor [Treponema sp.]|jgi:RNA polymerase sigma-70 factor (ECF subfamily)|nr:sigma-70 family RNA polymerase sigma factor [Treponema sp.]